VSTIFLGATNNVTEVLRTSAKQQLDSYADEWIVESIPFLVEIQ
jgi:hypothetical protein